MVCLTLDTDWAPGEILAEVLAMIESYGRRATVFCTSPYDADVLADHEVALHPNYFDRSLSEEEHLDRLQKLYPDAVGVRAHGLMFHGRLLTALYPQKNIRYSSDYAMPLQRDLRPFKILDLWQLPIFWADATWLRGRGAKDSDQLPDFASMDLGADSLKVFCFHPIHVFMNTPDMDFYAWFKPHYQEADRLRTMINGQRPGARDALLSLLEELDRLNLKSLTLRQVADRAESQEPAPEGCEPDAADSSAPVARPAKKVGNR